jgi:hypothetical protein
VNQQPEADAQKINLKSQAVTIPKTVLQPTGCQVRCREKQDHKLSNCPKYLSLNLGQRWEVVLKRKLCQFCLEADHRCAKCPTEKDFHYTLQREEMQVHYRPTYHKEAVAAAVPLEVAPVQLVVQEVKVQDGPKCVVMFDNGSQATLILNSFAKKAQLKRVGDSSISVRGIGSGMVQPNGMYELSMVKLTGGTVKVKAHGVDHVVGELPNLDLSPAKQAFVSIPEKEIQAPRGVVNLLIGLDHLYLHPVEVERTGNLVLYLSMFGIRTGWIVAGNLKEAARGTVWVGSVRQGHYVPLDFLSAEALGTETMRRCSACKKCKECQFRATVLSFKENAEYEAIVNNLSYSKELKRWTASYPFIEDPSVLADNKGQALACMKSLENRLKKQNRIDQFNKLFQEIVDRGVFKELSKEEMDAWEGPVN